MHNPDLEIEKLTKSQERIDLEMQYLRLCSVYDGNTVKQFVNDFKINPNATDKYKNNALMYALRPISYGLNKLDTIKTLCKMGVAPLRQNIFGFSPVALAAMSTGSYGFCSLNPVPNAPYAITLSDNGDTYDLHKPNTEITPKTLDFPYPINMLNLSDEEVAILCSGSYIDISLKSYNIKLLQHSWFSECVGIFKSNSRSVHDEAFFKRYINLYLKKKLKLVVWGFGEDPNEKEDKEDFNE